MPLVLPAKPGYDRLFYVVDNWDKETQVPSSDSLPLDQRRLPGSGEQYPYLCIGDFLEDTLILLENEINKDNFYPDVEAVCCPSRSSFLTISLPRILSSVR